MDRPGPVAQLRATLSQYARNHDMPRWCVALSGGPDSLALAAAAAAVLPTTALIVDHGLQASSADVAAAAHRQALHVGCVAAQVLRITVGVEGGPEAAARSARYGALERARDGAPVLLGHTLDDQAETVLLGLGRGSGPRSIGGMRPYDPPWCRPLLGIRRDLTHAACAELGLTPWHDPHNADPRFTRARLRSEVLPMLEAVLGGGVAGALARTATALREDTDTLDDMATQILDGLPDGGGLRVAAVGSLPEALRRRVVRGWLLRGGARALTDGQIRAVDALLGAWRGQGGVAVPGTHPRERLVAGRRDGHLVLDREPV